MKAKQIAAALLTGVFVNLFGRLFAGAKIAEKTGVKRLRFFQCRLFHDCSSLSNEPMISSLMPPVRALL